MNRTPVQSSNVVSIGYDAETQVLEIEFRSGVYQYQGVPRQVFDGLLAADSVGKAVNAIRHDYPFARVAA